MSCTVMRPESIRRIACTLADILNAHEHGQRTIATSALAPIAHHFRKYYKPNKGYQSESIAEELYRLNVAAYNGRYSTRENALLPLPGMPQVYTLHEQPRRTSEGESAAPWHFHLVKLLDCYLYQTEEDTTRAATLRLALEGFNNALMAGIIRSTAAYNAHYWGE